MLCVVRPAGIEPQASTFRLTASLGVDRWSFPCADEVIWSVEGGLVVFSAREASRRAGGRATGGRERGPADGFTRFEPAEVEQSIPARFERQVLRHGARLAVKTRYQALTYRQLNATANRIARAILARRGEGEEAIALLLEPDVLAAAAILGVLKAGKVAVYLDLALPPARRADMMRDAEPGLVLTSNRHASSTSALCGDAPAWLNLDALDGRLSDEDVARPIAPDAPCCIYYTSGSTGRPKGVVQTHRNVLHAMMNYTNSLLIGPEDRLALLHSYSFAASLTSFFGALLNGAALLPFDLAQEGLPLLARWLIDEEITVFYSGPSVFRHLVATLGGGESFPKLRLVRLVGEPVTSRDVELWRTHFSADGLFVNQLGSAETLMFRQYCIDAATSVATGVVPVGYACEDMEVLLLDEAGREVEPGEVGEIVVRSHYLSPGYWRQPALTAAAFRDDPDGGQTRLYHTGDLGSMAGACLTHLGRRDSQVKVRGHRVEVGEVEAALREHPALEDVVVVPRQDRSNVTRLVAYVVAHAPPAPSNSALRRFVSEKLHDYMVPAAFVSLPALPLTPNNKVDVRALPPPGRARPTLAHDFAPPRTPIEEKVAAIWAEVLDLDSVGIHDDFFDLGGDSLLVTQIISRIVGSFRAAIPLEALLAAPTVADMAFAITLAHTSEIGQEQITDMLSELQRLIAREPNGASPRRPELG